MFRCFEADVDSDKCSTKGDQDHWQYKSSWTKCKWKVTSVLFDQDDRFTPAEIMSVDKSPPSLRGSQSWWWQTINPANPLDSTPGSIAIREAGDVMSMTHHFWGNGNGSSGISVQAAGVEPTHPFDCWCSLSSNLLPVAQCLKTRAEYPFIRVE